MNHLKLASALLALSLLGSSCSSDPNQGHGADAGPPACATYQVPAGTDLTKPTSFKNDVLPIFVLSCAFSACHNESSNPHVFLGSKNDASLNTAVRGNIVSKPSTDLPSMPFVTPGDTSKSFLMRKMDGDNCMLNAQCVSGDCLNSMPDRSPLLDVPTRDVVRRWILQGALDN